MFGLLADIIRGIFSSSTDEDEERYRDSEENGHISPQALEDQRQAHLQWLHERSKDP